MDYKEKYKMAFERARKNYDVAQDLCNGSQIGVECFKNTLTNIFPELAESDDEKIRKELIAFIKKRDRSGCDYDYDKWIAWLEKQGEKSVKPNPYSGVSFKYKNHTFGMCAREGGVEIGIDGELKAFISSEKSFIYPIHPVPSLTPKSALEAINEEKVDNQNCVKPADKVEPKFKVGKWITHNTANFVFKIISVGSDGYEIVNRENYKKTISFDNEDNYHLWTIEDAKRGGVLQLGVVTVIFKEYIGNGNCKCYCSVYNGEFEIPSHDNSYGCHNATPATKEQRDLLFSKMKEAGYEWDAEKKELKKIEQKPVWSEEDERLWHSCIAHIEDELEQIRNDKYGHSEIISDLKESCRERIKWLESVKQRIKRC